MFDVFLNKVLRLRALIFIFEKKLKVHLNVAFTIMDVCIINNLTIIYYVLYEY